LRNWGIEELRNWGIEGFLNSEFGMRNVEQLQKLEIEELDRQNTFNS
jgi:hypothetical protein